MEEMMQRNRYEMLTDEKLIEEIGRASCRERV